MATLFPSILPGARESDESDDDRDAEERLDDGECPWCDRDGFDDAHQHARMAHGERYDGLEG